MRQLRLLLEAPESLGNHPPPPPPPRAWTTVDTAGRSGNAGPRGQHRRRQGDGSGLLLPRPGHAQPVRLPQITSPTD